MISELFRESETKNTIIMNNYIRTIFLTAAIVFVISLSASHASAQIAGGYSDVESNSKEVQKAATFAVKARSRRLGKSLKLIRIEKAETQVVAGMNYRLCMDVREGSGKITKATAVVYLDLKQHLSLSRWEKGGCKEL